VVVGAVGMPRLIQSDWIKKGRYLCFPPSLPPSLCESVTFRPFLGHWLISAHIIPPPPPPPPPPPSSPPSPSPPPFPHPNK